MSSSDTLLVAQTINVDAPLAPAVAWMVSMWPVVVVVAFLLLVLPHAWVLVRSMQE